MKLVAPTNYPYHIVTDPFRPEGAKGGRHSGIDTGWGKGLDVYAMLSGTVVERRYTNDWGNRVVIQYSPSISVTANHLATLNDVPALGSRVAQGQRIGTMGNTGLSTATHLHSELELGGRGPGFRVDPMPYFSTHLPGTESDEPAATVGGLPMFALYWTGPQVNNTKVSGRMVTGYGSFWVPSMQIMGLLNRRHDAALKAGDSHDNMLDAEHDIINNFLRTCFRSATTGVELDPAKLRSALTDALKAAGTNIEVEVDTVIDVDKLAAAFDAASPRIAASMVKQAGQAMAK